MREYAIDRAFHVLIYFYFYMTSSIIMYAILFQYFVHSPMWNGCLKLNVSGSRKLFLRLDPNT